MTCARCKYHVYIEAAYQALLIGVCKNTKSEHCDDPWDDGCPEWVGNNNEIGGQNETGR